MFTSFAAALVGIAFGLRHAFEPDHLAAVSTLASEQRGVGASLRVGLWWGLGHSLTLLLLAGSLSLLQLQLPPVFAEGLELGVAVMIVALGLRALQRALEEGRSGLPRPHAHGPTQHTHPVSGSHVHLSRWTLATRPLLIGAMHGLAGSGALVALLPLELPTVGARLLYIALFGLGATAGMSALTALWGLPLQRVHQSPRLGAALLGTAGLCSMALGAWWGVSSARALLGA